MATGGCEPCAVCRTPVNQTVNEGDQWTQYGAWAAIQPPFTICTNKGNVKVQVNDGGWKDCSSTTKIKLISGLQPQSILPNGCPYTCNCCNAGSSPRATWTLSANTGSGGSSWNCRIKMNYFGTNYYSFVFTITVNAPVGGAQAGKGKVFWIP